jgi:hypothetical protein
MGYDGVGWCKMTLEQRKIQLYKEKIGKKIFWGQFRVFLSIFSLYSCIFLCSRVILHHPTPS